MDAVHLVDGIIIKPVVIVLDLVFELASVQLVIQQGLLSERPDLYGILQEFEAGLGLFQICGVSQVGIIIPGAVILPDPEPGLKHRGFLKLLLEASFKEGIKLLLFLFPLLIGKIVLFLFLLTARCNQT